MNVLSAHRNHPTYWAFVLHRLSGLALAIFLPIHLYVLSMAIGGGARLDAFLDWTAQPAVKAAEVGLVVLLALHMAGGLRLLAVEFLPWRDSQKTFAAFAGAFAVAAGTLYLLNLV
jgi:fumarate reductase subunit D